MVEHSPTILANEEEARLTFTDPSDGRGAGRVVHTLTFTIARSPWRLQRFARAAQTVESVLTLAPSTLRGAALRVLNTLSVAWRERDTFTLAM